MNGESDLFLKGTKFLVISSINTMLPMFIFSLNSLLKMRCHTIIIKYIAIYIVYTVVYLIVYCIVAILILISLILIKAFI